LLLLLVSIPLLAMVLVVCDSIHSGTMIEPHISRRDQ
jgi:hypothetical protein